MSNRFSHSVVIAATRRKTWRVLQDAEVWGRLAGVYEVFDVEVTDDQQLKRCKWRAEIATRDVEGTMRVTTSEPLELMRVRVEAHDWKAMIGARLEPTQPRSTFLEAEFELRVDGWASRVFLPVVSRAVGSHFPERVETLAEIVVEE